MSLLLVWVCRIWYIIVVLGFCVFRLCCLLCGAVCVAIIPDLGLVGFNGGCFCGCGVGFGGFWCYGFLVGLVDCLCF